MTARRRVYIYCDVDGENCQHGFGGNEATEGNSDYDNVSDYRRDLRAEGWTFHGGRDICPACRKRPAADQPQASQPNAWTAR